MKDQLTWMTVPITIASYVVSIGVIAFVGYQLRSAYKENKFRAEI